MSPRWTLPALIGVLCLGACSAVPSAPAAPATAAWLARFAQAMKFVPDGMKCHWFSDHRALSILEGEAPPLFTQVRCGRNFQGPRDVGIGAYDGVTIEDYGTNVIPGDRSAELGEPRPAIAGAPVWFRAASAPGVRPLQYDKWSTVVDARFVIVATSEGLLHEALQRRGAPRFGSLEPLPEIDPAAVDLVVRDLEGVPMPADARMLLNAPGFSVIAAFSAQPCRVQMWGRNELETRGLARFCFADRLFAVRPLERSAGFHVFELTPLGDRPEGDAPPEFVAQLGLCLVFGWWIFI